MPRTGILNPEFQCEPYAAERTGWGESYLQEECFHEPVQRHRSRAREARQVNQLALIALASTVTQLRRRIEQLESAPQPLSVPINTFAPRPFEITTPIMVLVEPVVDEDGEPCEYIATFPDGAISVTGETVEDAVTLLKDRMIAQYDRLSKVPWDRLGRIPKQQLCSLRGVMRKTE